MSIRLLPIEPTIGDCKCPICGGPTELSLAETVNNIRRCVFCRAKVVDARTLMPKGIIGKSSDWQIDELATPTLK